MGHNYCGSVCLCVSGYLCVSVCGGARGGGGGGGGGGVTSLSRADADDRTRFVGVCGEGFGIAKTKRRRLPQDSSLSPS